MYMYNIIHIYVYVYISAYICICLLVYALLYIYTRIYINLRSIIESIYLKHLQPESTYIADVYLWYICMYVNCVSVSWSRSNCNTLQYTATHLNTLQYDVCVFDTVNGIHLYLCGNKSLSALQHSATPCTTLLQHTATRCITLCVCKWVVSICNLFRKSRVFKTRKWPSKKNLCFTLPFFDFTSIAAGPSQEICTGHHSHPPSRSNCNLFCLLG